MAKNKKIIKHHKNISKFENGGTIIQPNQKLDFDMERPLPSDVSYERDVEKFSWSKKDKPLEERIPLDSSYMLYKTPKGYSNVYDKKGKQVGYTVDNKVLIQGEPQFKYGGKLEMKKQN